MEPQIQNVEIEKRAKLTANVSGVGIENFSYKWKHDGIDMTGETGKTLEISCMASSNGGKYECIVENKFGDGNSSTAQVIVTSKHCMNNI